jgi:hypothetical protein
VNPVALIRAAYGAVLVSAPGTVLNLFGGPAEDDRARVVARVLGARHILQAAVTRRGRFPRLGAMVDSLHAASMFGLAALGSDYRTAALVDGAVATMLCITELRQAGR